MTTDPVRNVGGFQGSENTGVEVKFYPQGDDPVEFFQESFAPSGRVRYDVNPSIVSCTTTEQLGAASGTWSITLKEGKRHRFRGLFADLVDDDWVDISFYRHGKKWHVMRGLVDEVRRNRQAGLNKGTTTTWTISGRSFGSIWEKTPIWFNVYSDENVAGSISQQVFQSAENVLGPPDDAVDGFLFGFLRELGSLGRANWVMPQGMVGAGDRFVDSFITNYLGYPNNPPLTAINSNWLCPTGTLWALAQEWSDPMFNELIVTMYRAGQARPDFDLQPGAELLVDDAKMYVVMRERPFPTVLQGRSSPWFQLPLWTIPPQMLVADSLGRGGTERYNAYFVAPQLVQEAIPEAGLDLAQPLWDPTDIEKHGLRRMDITSKYTSPSADLAGLSSAQRIKIRDWYCLNPYFLNGSLELAIGLPDIRPGVRLRISDGQNAQGDLTFYVETVTHNWAFGVGLKDSIGVSRGWIGTDDELMRSLKRVVSAYEVPNRAQPSETKIPS